MVTKSRPRRHRRAVVACGALALALTTLLGAVLFTAGEVLSAPAPASIGRPPAALLDAQVVGFDSEAGGRIAGWFARGAPGRGAVLLLHGVRGDRRQMLARAQALHGRGYSVLLIDLPAHGESSGVRISFGHHEAEGVRASLRFLAQTLPGEKMAVVGVSLGAAAFVLAEAAPAPNAVVLESMYPTIEEAVADRLRQRAGAFGAACAPLLLTQLPLRLGITAQALRPIDRLSNLRAPVLIVAGTADRYTTQAETQRLFAAAAEPKELWLVEGAGHQDLYRYDPRGYEQRVFGFLARQLGGS